MMWVKATMLATVLLPTAAAGQARVEKNIVFGSYSGLALLMDAHRPAKPNGYGLILIAGTGFNSVQAYDARAINDINFSQISFFAPKLLDAGYTLFAVSYRNGPHFRFPDPVEDVQRAVRFVRYHAKDYGLDPNRIGAFGYSSGGYLSAMLGVLDGKGDPSDSDPINRESARVQCVVASAAPTDLEHFDGIMAPIAVFVGMVLRPFDQVTVKTYRSASPITHVSSTSAPMLLLNGEADPAVPVRQGELMLEAMKGAGAQARMIHLPGGSHLFASEVPQHPEWPDIFSESLRWLDEHLRKPGAAGPK